MYLKADKRNRYDERVRDVQNKLNVIRNRHRHSWLMLDTDGIYGPLSADAVEAFQMWRHISSQKDENGRVILGDTTIRCVEDVYFGGRSGVFWSDTKRISAQTYGYASTGIQTGMGMVDNFDTLKEFIDDTEKLLSQQARNFTNSIKRIPANARLRHIEKGMSKAQEYLANLKKTGFDLTKRVTTGEISTKQDLTRYLRECSRALTESFNFKVFKTGASVMEKIKNALKPLYNFFKFLNKIPGLKYLGALEKLFTGTWKLFTGQFEEAAGLFMDGVRELIESVVVDAVAALIIAAGGWIALVLALVFIIIVMIVDYFFFSDNSGDSWVDRHTSLHTQNLVRDKLVPTIYNLVNK